MREELKRLVKDEEEIDAAVHDFIYRVSEAADNPVIAAVTAVDVASASVLAFRLLDEKKFDGGNDVADALVELFILQTCKPEDFLRVAGKMMQELGGTLSEARKKVEEKEKKEREVMRKNEEEGN